MIQPAVLCIDHSPAVLSAMSIALRDAGYIALTACGTVQAIRALAYVHFDAIVVDPHELKLQSIADVLDIFSPDAKILLHSTVADLASHDENWGHAIVTKPADAATVVAELEFLLTEFGVPLPKRAAQPQLINAVQ